tara:strand:- start:661 stop:1068 length:408 start_codon:yes stop_codon:yes gene_type:complete
MKKITLLFVLISTIAVGQTKEDSYQKLLEESPFNIMYPQFMAEDAAEYFKEFNKLFSDSSPIAPKEARLVAIGVSAAVKCEYCIAANVHLARKLGATEDEIKAAVQIAAEIQRFSTLLYGNDFGMEKLNKAIGKE